MRVSNGEIVAYEGTMEDITERKRVELERQVTFEIFIHAVNVTDNLDDLSYLVHQALKKVLYAENCFVALYEPSSGIPHFPFFIDQFDEAPPPQQVGRSCTAYVYRTGRAMLILQQIFDHWPSKAKWNWSARRRRRGSGRPCALRRLPSAFWWFSIGENEAAYTERDLEFLVSVGGQIALAIERKRGRKNSRKAKRGYAFLWSSCPPCSGPRLGKTFASRRLWARAPRLGPEAQSNRRWRIVDGIF